MVKIYDRENKQYYDEVQYGEKLLNFLYNNMFGRLLLKIAITKGFSRIEQRRKDSRKSVKEIEPFIKKYNIKIDDFEKKDYCSFNDFFTRRLINGKRPASFDDNGIISPADSKLRVFNITDNLQLNIKHSVYAVEELLQDKKLAKSFAGGTCFVYRLTVDDYHRYCFSQSGDISFRRKIDGVLHTVSSLSNTVNVYCENCREYCVIETENVGNVIQMEVGAMLVGKIINADVKTAIKGEEKGFFSYGGSTIIVLYERGRVKPDVDIQRNSDENIETKVKYREAVGKIIC